MKASERAAALPAIDPTRVPQHVAIIMDGNGRWARERGLPRMEGHRAGREAVRRTLEACRDLAIGNLTLYAFSTENWRRPNDEVEALMLLLRGAVGDVANGLLTPEAIDDARFSRYLYTDGLPDPDLLIRTGGEQRISNFLLWQIAYTELYFCEVYWPDFGAVHFRGAARAHQGRGRRLGGVDGGGGQAGVGGRGPRPPHPHGHRRHSA